MTVSPVLRVRPCESREAGAQVLIGELPCGASVGSVTLMIHERMTHIIAFDLDPSHLNMGHGRRLLLAAECWGDMRGAGVLVMRAAHDRDPSHPGGVLWCKRLGFQIVANSVPPPGVSAGAGMVAMMRRGH